MFDECLTQRSCAQGPLGWSPGENSYFGAAEQLLISVSSARISIPFMKRVGNRRAFEIGALIGALGCEQPLLTRRAERK